MGLPFDVQSALMAMPSPLVMPARQPRGTGIASCLVILRPRHMEREPTAVGCSEAQLRRPTAC